MIELKTPGELAAMRAAGQVVATALATMREAAGVGVSLLALDAVAQDVLVEHRAKSSFLDYLPSFAPTPFPAVICASVNEVIVHGIPDRTRLRDGDLVSLDFAAIVDGWHADSAISFTVGAPRAADTALIETTDLALRTAISLAVPGGRLGDLSNAITQVARGAGYGMQGDFGGHGIGRAMHEAPFVPNSGRPGRGLRLRTGMVLAIEPMLHHGGDDYAVGEDGWALHTTDRRRAAHAEHSVAITDDGPVVLTELQGASTL
ncbi:type I methionyl aminopeptidase [Actinokineospora sp. NBRC 105648]|uniref:type I methionyl aminopeptidase n=1 Tax=Actinokineospora sp. NBRC 105648 TaxID=3032206 RepID=UPI0024A24397|nr:type I methionyl aminopeptidase [Actinokineospora sp. NBRC 105648]GLZ39170.1 methionine aminopeptidase [Actinokineospora sp. NBRC 105648]